MSGNTPTSVAAVSIESLTFTPEAPNLNDQDSDMIERKSPMNSSILTTNHHESFQPPISNLVDLLSDQRFWSRIITLFVTIFLWFLTILYSYAQILQLKLTDYWCDRRTIDEIHQHSLKYNLNYGMVDDRCWMSKEVSVTSSFRSITNIFKKK